MGVRAKKSLGQHFLNDDGAVLKIVEAAQIEAHNTVVEIGPGLGALTENLVAVAQRILAVEIDGELCGYLRQKFAHTKAFELVQNDVRQVNLLGLVCDVEQADAVLVGNLPYQITGALIRQILDARKAYRQAIIMVQREVAQRMVAQPGGKDFGVLTAVTQINCVPELLFDLPPASFDPPPKVHSSVLRLRFDCDPLFQVSDEGVFLKVVHAAFQQRRKMVRNTLRALLGQETLIEVLAQADIDGSLRPEALRIDQFDRIAQIWSHRS